MVIDDAYYKVRNKKHSYDLEESVEMGTRTARDDKDNCSLHTIQEEEHTMSSPPCTPQPSQEMSDIPEYVHACIYTTVG